MQKIKKDKKIFVIIVLKNVHYAFFNLLSKQFNNISLIKFHKLNYKYISLKDHKLQKFIKILQIMEIVQFRIVFNFSNNLNNQINKMLGIVLNVKI